MKAVTLSQPWATLAIVPRIDTRIRSKQIESRGWHPGEQLGISVKGAKLGIHAGKGIDRDVRDAITTSDGVSFTEPYASALAACGYSTFSPWDRDYVERTLLHAQHEKRATTPKLLPLGALLGCWTLHGILSGAKVIELHRAGRISDLEIALGFYDETNEKRFGWVSSSATELDAPITMRGFQKLWELPRDIAAVLER